MELNRDARGFLLNALRAALERVLASRGHVEVLGLWSGVKAAPLGVDAMSCVLCLFSGLALLASRHNFVHRKRAVPYALSVMFAFR